MIGAIIGAVGEIAGSWVKGKADEAKAKQKAKLKVIENEGNWEQIMARGASTSWKDEWFTIILSIPLIGAFIPDAVPYIMAGFQALQATPDWYQWLILAVFAAIYGIRIWRRK